jgi:hypothetical protein
MQRKSVAGAATPGALVRRGLVAAKKAAMRKPARPVRVVRRLAKPGGLPARSAAPRGEGAG